jgi:hypothetical protein
MSIQIGRAELCQVSWKEILVEREKEQARGKKEIVAVELACATVSAVAARRLLKVIQIRKAIGRGQGEEGASQQPYDQEASALRGKIGLVREFTQSWEAVAMKAQEIQVKKNIELSKAIYFACLNLIKRLHGQLAAVRLKRGAYSIGAVCGECEGIQRKICIVGCFVDTLRREHRARQLAATG